LFLITEHYIVCVCGIRRVDIVSAVRDCVGRRLWRWHTSRHALCRQLLTLHHLHRYRRRKYVVMTTRGLFVL